MKARKISVAMNGPWPSTMKMMNAIIPRGKEIERRTKAGCSVADNVVGDPFPECLEFY